MQTHSPDSSEVIPFPLPPATELSRSAGYDNVRFNALKHGVLSKHAVLAHEDSAEFNELLGSLAAEHAPAGPTEMHLVEELAGIIWRKRRVLQAEAAAINRGLLAVSKTRHDRLGDPDGPAMAAVPFEPQMAGTRLNHPTELAEAIRLTPTEVRKRIAEAEADLAAILKAADILRRGGVRAYDRAVRALTDSYAQWWVDNLDDEEGEATAESLAKFLHDDMLSAGRQALIEAQNHDAIKTQTLGEGLQTHRLEKLNRYETYLDRKFERTLAMLLKLKELRRGA